MHPIKRAAIKSEKSLSEWVREAVAAKIAAQLAETETAARV